MNDKANRDSNNLHSVNAANEDQIFLDLVSEHPLTDFNEVEFVQLVRRSLSLSISEKKRVLDSVPVLSQFQINTIINTFRDEQSDFDGLRLKGNEAISALEEHSRTGWVALKDLYLAEPEMREKALLSSIYSPPTQAEIRTIETFLGPYNGEIIRALSRKPDDLYQLSPRQFEILMAEILSDLGWDVELTPESKDGGRDIIATIPFGTTRLLGIVECKKYSPEYKVGIDIVERFIYTIREKDKASFGMMATSSFFTQGAWDAAQAHQWQLQLNDYEHICQLLRNYGHYKKNPTTGIWVFPKA